METPIAVIDADLVMPNDPMSNIHVWYALGDKEHQIDICGFAFHHWLPIPIRSTFRFELRSYWYSIHPFLRNEHLAAFMASLIEQPQPFVSMLQSL